MHSIFDPTKTSEVQRKEILAKHQAGVTISELSRQYGARKDTFPNAGSYFQASAVTVYLAWCDVTEGWHTEEDLERLEALTTGTAWAN